jgi:hypothetical protein
MKESVCMKQDIMTTHQHLRKSYEDTYKDLPKGRDTESKSTMSKYEEELDEKFGAHIKERKIQERSPEGNVVAGTAFTTRSHVDRTRRSNRPA